MKNTLVNRLRERRWLWWHMRHTHTTLTKSTWFCSCGSVRDRVRRTQQGAR